MQELRTDPFSASVNNFVQKLKIIQNLSYTEDVMAGRPPINEAPVFGGNLAALPKAQGWTQPQLAHMLAISVDALVYYERKAKNPTADILSKVSKLFNVSIDELLGHPIKSVGRAYPRRLSHWGTRY